MLWKARKMTMEMRELIAHLSSVTISGQLNDVYRLGMKLEEEGAVTELREGADCGGYYLIVDDPKYPF